MKFQRTFTCNQEHEITAARLLIPDAPVFGCCVLHGATNEAPSRIDLYRSARPHETSEPAFCVYDRSPEGEYFTDYDVSSPAAAAVSSKKGKKK